MYYFVKLIDGNDYTVSGMRFSFNQEVEVTKSTYEYLKDKREFSVREEPKLHSVSIKKVIEE